MTAVYVSLKASVLVMDSRWRGVRAQGGASPRQVPTRIIATDETADCTPGPGNNYTCSPWAPGRGGRPMLPGCGVRLSRPETPSVAALRVCCGCGCARSDEVAGSGRRGVDR